MRRNVKFYLIISVYLSLLGSYLPLAKELSKGVLLFLIPMALGLRMDFKKEWPISSRFYKYIFTPLVILVTLLVFIFQFDIESLAYLLLFMESVKLLGRKANRDIFQLLLLGLFNVLLGSVFTIDLIFLLSVVLYFVGASLAFGLMNVLSTAGDIPISGKETKQFMGILAVTPLVSFGLAVFFFFVMPRSAYIIFEANLAGRSFARGIPSQVELGEVAGEFLSSRPVFRAYVQGEISKENLYWRGMCYDYFDGKIWISTLPRRRNKSRVVKFEVKTEGTDVPQRILLEPMHTSAIFTLDHPFYLEVPFSPSLISDDGRFITCEADFSKRIIYRVYSVVGPIFQPRINTSMYLQVPERLYPIFKTLADSVVGSWSDPLKAAAKVEFFFLKNFRYSLRTDFDSRNPVVEFLKKREGFCEYFATSMTLMLRCLGIPARTVAGFKGGEWNPYGHYYLVREKDAHMWVEVYVDSMWIRFDPTPYATEALGRSTIQKIIKTVQNYLDYLKVIWYGDVVNYTFERQISMFSKIGVKMYRFRRKFGKNELKEYGFLFLLSLFLLNILYGFWRYWKSLPSDPAVRLYLKAVKAMERKKKVRKKESETPLEFALRLKDKDFIEFTLDYYRVRYGDEGLEILKKRFKTFGKAETRRLDRNT